jgi:hypothetical protein
VALKLDATTYSGKRSLQLHYSWFSSIFDEHLAEVVELVDALASGASGRKLVGVRVPPSALASHRGEF